MVASIGRNRVAQRGAIEVALVGDSELVAAMQEITSGMVDKVAPAGIRAYLRVCATSIKAEIPGHLKEARKGIGSRFAKRDKRRQGRVTAMVGVGVGIKQARAKESAEKAKQGRRPGEGVGISANNLHWAIMGTALRSRWRTGAGMTGRMPPIFPQLIRRGLLRSRGEAVAKFREMASKAIDKEARKIRAKARALVNQRAKNAGAKAAKGVVKGLM